MEMVPDTDKFTIHTCRYVFCRSCMSRSVAAKINDNVVDVGCPDPDARRLSSELLSKWGFMLCEAALGARRLYFPLGDCSAPLLADDDGKAITDSECPHCHRLFCARCAVPWHDGISCEEFRELGEDDRGREDFMVWRLAGEQRWERCPQCRMYVEKSDGCVFMQCRCGHCICCTCASPMSKELHYCNGCNRSSLAEA